MRIHIAFPCICVLVSLTNLTTHVAAYALNDVDSASEVYVNDSFEAADALNKAREFAHKGRWSEAADTLQRIADMDADKVVAVAPHTYVGLREHAANMIREWPPEGIAAYESFAQRLATEAIESIPEESNLAALLEVFDRYFGSTVAAELADRIGQIAIEAGEFAIAERVYRRVLTEHPRRAAFELRYRGKLAIAVELQGHETTNLHLNDDTVEWMGKTRRVADVLAEIPHVFGSLFVTESSAEWPIFAGNFRRERIAPQAIDELGLLWRYDAAPGGEPAQRSVVPDTRTGAQANTNRLSPVVAGGAAYIQSFRRISALRLTTGAVLWQFDAEEGSFDSDNWEDRQSSWDSVTVADERVYAALPTDADPYYGSEKSIRPAAIVCLNAEDGRLLWRADSRTLTSDSTEIVFDSSPIVYAGKVYVIGRRLRAFGFEDCYLFCLRAKDGRLEFRSHLGSASTGTFSARQPTTTMPAMEGDTLYVNTNLGSITAVSAQTGAVRWLRVYPRELGKQSDGSVWSLRDTPSWAFNPIIFSEGNLFSLPTDSNQLFILDARTGESIQTIPVGQIEDMQSVLGVRGPTICGMGAEIVCFDRAEKVLQINWSAGLTENEQIVGRGIWAEDELLIPTSAKLLRFRVIDGQRTETPWEPGGRGGNVLVLQDHLLVGGSGLLSTYVRKSLMWKVLRDRMAESPDDPGPALELAEIALRGGETEQSLDAINEAVRRADANPPAHDSPLRRRVYADAIAIVNTLNHSGKLTVDSLTSLYDIAARFSPDIEAHLEHRLLFAEVFDQLGKSEQAVQLLQQILRDRSLRDVTVSKPDAGRAADVARSMIDQLIARRGRSIYAVLETDAHQLLESGRQVNDLETLARVVSLYPNSQAAADSLIAQSQTLILNSRFEEAAKRLTQAFHRYSDFVDRAEVMRGIADCYEKGGNLEKAYRWLSRAGREYPTHLIDHQGQTITFSQYRDRLADVRTRIEPQRPNIDLPLERVVERELEDGGALLLPKFSDHPTCRWSRYFVADKNTIQGFDSSTGRSLWDEPASTKAPAELLISTKDFTLFATLYEIFALDVHSGNRIWSYGEYPQRLKDANADWEDGQPIRYYVYDGDQLVLVRDSGQLTRLSAKSGEVRWSVRHNPPPINRIWLIDESIVYPAVQDGQSVLCLVDAPTGSWIGSIAIQERRPVEELLTPIDGQLVIITAQSMAAVETETGKWLWRTAFEGHMRRSSLIMDMDVIYLSNDGAHLQKYSLEDGKQAWESDKLVARGAVDIAVERMGETIFVSTSVGLMAIDAADGRLLWEATTPPRPRFAKRVLTQSYLAAFDIPPGEMRDADGFAYFYDHRNASGLIPREGGVRNLGRLNDVRAILPVDGALLIQNGSTLHEWRAK